MTAATPPIATGLSSTRTSIGSTVALALASPSSSTTWTCSGSRRGFCCGSKYSRAWPTSPPKAATMTRASASPSPSLYLRICMGLRTLASDPESNGWGQMGSGPRSGPAPLCVLRGFAGARRIPFDGAGQPAAPLGVPPLVEDAAAQRRVGGEARRVGAAQVIGPLPFHPGSDLLVPGQLLFVATTLPGEEPRSRLPVHEPHGVGLEGHLVAAQQFPRQQTQDRKPKRRHVPPDFFYVTLDI